MFPRTWTYVWGVALTFSISLMRLMPRLKSAELWAEDSSLYFHDHWARGFGTLLEPYGGYLHIVQRLLFSIAYLFPVEALPVAISMVCLIVFSLTAALIVRPCYAWLLPETSHRFLLALAFCFAPGLTEMLGNLANINWFLFMACAFTLLKDPKEDLNKWDLSLLTVCFFSIGTGILLTPLIFWRVSYGRRHEIAAFVILCAHVGVLLWIREARWSQVPTASVGVALLRYVRNVNWSVFIQPWFGDRWVTHLVGMKHAQELSLWILGLSLLLTSVWFIRFLKLRSTLPVSLFLFGQTLWLVLCWFGRPGSIDHFAQPPFDWFFSHRYSFPMAFAAFLFWFVLLQNFLKKPVMSTFGIAALTGLIVAHALYRFPIEPYGTARLWETAAPQFKSQLTTGCPARVDIRAYPLNDFDFSMSSTTCVHDS